MATDSVPPERTTPRAVQVELLSHEGCPLVDHTRTLVRGCLAEAGLTAPVIEKVGDYPSPTVLIDGQDVMDDSGAAPEVAACRVDTPTRDRVLRALHTARRQPAAPTHPLS